MAERLFTILILFLSVFQKFVHFSSWGAEIKCKTGCPFKDDSYNLTCTSSSSGNCDWFEGSTNVMTCASGGACTPQELGYNGFRISDTNYVLQINNLKAATFFCKLGADPQVTCSVEVVTALPVGTIIATCSSDVITCSGINDHGTPAVTLELRDGTDVLASTTTGGSVSSTQSGSAGKTYTCAVTGTGSTCLSATSVDVTCSITPPRPDDCLIILIVAIVVLIVCVIAVVACFFGNKKLFRTIAILCGVIMICTGIGCTISAFVVCQTDSPIGIAACFVSILDIAVGILTIIIRFLLFPLK